METNATTVENFEEAANVAGEMIEAGKDVLVDMSQEGKYSVSEIAKPSLIATYGPMALFGAGCAVVGGLITFGVSKLIKAHGASKAKPDVADEKTVSNDDNGDTVDNEETGDDSTED